MLWDSSCGRCGREGRAQSTPGGVLCRLCGGRQGASDSRVPRMLDDPSTEGRRGASADNDAYVSPQAIGPLHKRLASIPKDKKAGILRWGQVGDSY